MKMELEIYKKPNDFFSNLEPYSNSFNKPESHAAYFFWVYRILFSQSFEMHTLFVIIWVGTALCSPRALIPYSASCRPLFGCSWAMAPPGHSVGQSCHHDTVGRGAGNAASSAGPQIGPVCSRYYNLCCTN